MTNRQPAPFGPRNSDCVGSAFLQQPAHPANRHKKCDMAVALAHNLSDQLGEAHNRITALEDEADGLLDRLLAELQTAIETADADAGVDRTIREADERIARLQAELLARAKRDIEQVKAEADIHIERIKIEAEARVAAAQREAKKRFELMQGENEEKILRLEADLVEANNRAERAEQWLILIRREIDDNFIPAMKTMHNLMRGKPIKRGACSTQDHGVA
jgi:gas vesicle protein